jgi:hypothetical protein
MHKLQKNHATTALTPPALHQGSNSWMQGQFLSYVHPQQNRSELCHAQRFAPKKFEIPIERFELIRASPTRKISERARRVALLASLLAGSWPVQLAYGRCRQPNRAPAVSPAQSAPTCKGFPWPDIRFATDGEVLATMGRMWVAGHVASLREVSPLRKLR